MTVRAALSAYAAAIALFVYATLGREPYDDSYFFKRFALNALEHGSLSWNAEDGPVYGSTSQLFQWFVIPLTAIAGDYTLLATRLCLAAFLVGAFGLLLACTHRLDRGLAAALAFCSPVALFAVSSGMETALCLFVICGGLWLLHRDRAHAQHWLWAPLSVLALWLTRPDAVPLLLIPLLVERWRETGRAPLREASLVLAGAALCLALFRLYYGTALPLPFYAKQLALSPYDAGFVAISRSVQRLHVGLFATAALPLAALAALRRDRTNLALLAAALTFVLYHSLATIDVMGMHGRFYAPALPVLGLAAARSAEVERPRATSVMLIAACALALGALAVAGWIPGPSLDRFERVMLPYFLPSVVGALALLAAPSWRRLRELGAAAVLLSATLALVVAHGLKARMLPSDDDFLQLHQSHVTVYRGLETLRDCFGPAIDVYHSEVGVPGLRFQDGSVHDLAGLLDREWLFRERSFDSMCQRDAPEAIFLPHRNYAALNREIRQGSCLGGYAAVVTDSSSPLYVRADLLERFHACAARR